MVSEHKNIGLAEIKMWADYGSVHGDISRLKNLVMFVRSVNWSLC